MLFLICRKFPNESGYLRAKARAASDDGAARGMPKAARRGCSLP